MSHLELYLLKYDKEKKSYTMTNNTIDQYTIYRLPYVSISHKCPSLVGSILRLQS